jgi:hypothetical protein
VPHRSRRALLAAATALLFVFGALLVPAQAVTNGTITGTVTRPGGELASDGYLLAYKANNLVAYPTERNIDNGAYSMSLPPGEYLLYFRPQGFGDNQFAPEWWDNSTTRAGATPITVVAGEVFTADAELALAGSISGHVATNHPDLGYMDTEVTAYQADSSYPGGWAKRPSSGADENGDFTVGYLPAGEYKLYFFSQLSKYEGWWPNATTLDGATTITVAEGETVTGKDPVLTPAGTISGKVTIASNGTPVKNVDVQMFYDFGHGFVAVGADFWGSTITATDGTFTLHAPTDTYKLKFTPPTATKLRPEYWNNTTKPGLSTSVNVAAGVDMTSINPRLEKNTFTLTTAAAITGILKVGQYLKAVPPKSTPTSTYTTYQWLRNGKAISGTAAKKSYYKLVAADRGTRIGVKITLNRAGYVPAYRVVTRKLLVQ